MCPWQVLSRAYQRIMAVLESEESLGEFPSHKSRNDGFHIRHIIGSATFPMRAQGKDRPALHFNPAVCRASHFTRKDAKSKSSCIRD